MKWNNKKLKYGLNSSILVIGIIAIIAIVNIFVTMLVEKFPVKIDLTSSQRYEISDTTYEFLKSYNTPTTIYVLASEANEDLIIKNILSKYATNNSYIKVENINMTENPTFGKKYVKDGQSLMSNSVIIDTGDRFKVYSLYDLYNFQTEQTSGQQYASSIKAEQKITAGLKYVSSGEEFNVYFLQGHNEADLTGAKQILTENNYTVNDLNITTEEIPETAKMIVIANPTVDYTIAEIAKLDKFFANAGKAQFIFDHTSVNLPNLYNYIKEWGIQINDDIAVEGNKSNKILVGNSGMFLIKPELAESDITAPIESTKRMMGYYPYAKSITPMFESNSGIEVVKLLTTSDNTYTTTDFETAEKTQTSKTGAATVAAVSTKQGASPDRDSIIFVSGSVLLLDLDNTIVTDQFGFANADFYMNTVNYIQGSQDDYTIPAKTLATDRLTISAFDGILLGAIIVFVIPLAALITGIVIWFRRRHL